jgi:hypothetical protein
MNLRFASFAIGLLAVIACLGAWLFVTKQGPFSSGVLPRPTIAFIESDLRDLGLATVELRPGAHANGVSWQVTFRGKILLGRSNYREDRQLEPIRLVFKQRSNFSSKSCPSGGFYLNSNILCPDGLDDFQGGNSVGLFNGYEPMGLDCWLPIYNDVTRAGLQDPNGTILEIFCNLEGNSECTIGISPL